MSDIEISTVDDMTCYSHDDLDISRIVVPTPFGVGPVNVYFLEHEGKKILVDAGPNDGHARDCLRAGLGKLGVKQIDTLLVTHNHMDHSGLARFVVDEFGAKVALHEQCREYFSLSGRESRHEVYAEIFKDAGFPPHRASFIGKILMSYNRYGCQVDSADLVSVAEGHDPDLGGEIIYCTGHSEDLIALKTGPFLLCGDVLWKDKTPNSFFSRGREDRGLTAFLKTMEKTRALDFGMALPGHGEPMIDYRGYIDFVLAHHKKRASDIYDVLSAGEEKTAYELIMILFSDRLDGDELADTDTYFLGLSEVLGNLERFEEAGKVVNEKRDGVTYYGLNISA